MTQFNQMKEQAALREQASKGKPLPSFQSADVLRNRYEAVLRFDGLSQDVDGILAREFDAKLPDILRDVPKFEAHLQFLKSLFALPEDSNG